MPSEQPHPPVLMLVPGAYDAQAAEPHLLADADAPQLRVTDFVATRGDGVFETIGVFDGTPVNVGPHLARLVRSADRIDLPARTSPSWRPRCRPPSTPIRRWRS